MPRKNTPEPDQSWEVRRIGRLMRQSGSPEGVVQDLFSRLEALEAMVADLESTPAAAESDVPVNGEDTAADAASVASPGPADPGSAA